MICFGTLVFPFLELNRLIETPPVLLTSQMKTTDSSKAVYSFDKKNPLICLMATLLAIGRETTLIQTNKNYKYHPSHISSVCS